MSDILQRIYSASQPWNAHAFRGIYFLFKDRDLQYIGKAENVLTRLRAHWLKSSLPRVSFNRVATIFLDGSEPFALEQIESCLIAALKPPCNTAIKKGLAGTLLMDDLLTWLACTEICAPRNAKYRIKKLRASDRHALVKRTFDGLGN